MTNEEPLPKKVCFFPQFLSFFVFVFFDNRVERTLWIVCLPFTAVPVAMIALWVYDVLNIVSSVQCIFRIFSGFGKILLCFLHALLLAYFPNLNSFDYNVKPLLCFKKGGEG